MVPLLVKYPFDKTGTSLNNIVLGEQAYMEPHPVRTIAPVHGSFYTKSMRVVIPATGVQLKRGLHYDFSGFNQEATMETGQEVHQLLIITDPSIPDTVFLNYQAVGGQYANHIDAIEQLSINTQLDDRPVYFNNVTDTPNTVPATKHLHDIGDIYDFNEVVFNVDRIRQALELKDTLSLDSLYLLIDQKSQQNSDGIATESQLITDHINDQSNPHKDTADTIGAYTIQAAQAKITTYSNLLNDSISSIYALLNSHIAAWNPHQTDAALLGTMTSSQMDVAMKNMAGGIHPAGSFLGVYCDKSRIYTIDVIISGDGVTTNFLHKLSVYGITTYLYADGNGGSYTVDGPHDGSNCLIATAEYFGQSAPPPDSGGGG